MAVAACDRVITTVVCGSRARPLTVKAIFVCRLLGGLSIDEVQVPSTVPLDGLSEDERCAERMAQTAFLPLLLVARCYTFGHGWSMGYVQAASFLLCFMPSVCLFSCFMSNQSASDVQDAEFCCRCCMYKLQLSRYGCVPLVSAHFNMLYRLDETFKSVKCPALLIVQ